MKAKRRYVDWRLQWYDYVLAALAVLLWLIVFGTTVSAAGPVAGTVRSAGPVYQGRQYVCYTRSDVPGWTCLPVAITGGATYSRGAAIWVHVADGRIAGLSHRPGGQ